VSWRLGIGACKACAACRPRTRYKHHRLRITAPTTTNVLAGLARMRSGVAQPACQHTQCVLRVAHRRCAHTRGPSAGPRARPLAVHGDLLGEALLLKVADRVVVGVCEEELQAVVHLGRLLRPRVHRASCGSSLRAMPRPTLVTVAPWPPPAHCMRCVSCTRLVESDAQPHPDIQS